LIILIIDYPAEGDIYIAGMLILIALGRSTVSFPLLTVVPPSQHLTKGMTSRYILLQNKTKHKIKE